MSDQFRTSAPIVDELDTFPKSGLVRHQPALPSVELKGTNMPAYTVLLYRPTLEWTEMEIEADSEQEAKQQALKIAKAPKNDLYWEADESNAEDPEVNEVLLTHGE